MATYFQSSRTYFVKPTHVKGNNNKQDKREKMRSVLKELPTGENGPQAAFKLNENSHDDSYVNI